MSLPKTQFAAYASLPKGIDEQTRDMMLYAAIGGLVVGLAVQFGWYWVFAKIREAIFGS